MYIMKKNILMLSALFLSITAMAQTDVTTGVMRGKDYGVTYMLPKTEIEIVLQATKHTYTPGEFCRYADRYLRLNNVSAEPEEFWTLDKIETRIAGVPDKDNVYFVKMKDKTVAPLMELTEDGIVRSINIPFSGKPAAKTPEAKATESSIDPRSFLTEEILMSNSSAKMAELVAKEIYSIRESKNALLRGVQHGLEGVRVMRARNGNGLGPDCAGPFPKLGKAVDHGSSDLKAARHHARRGRRAGSARGISAGRSRR